MRAETLGPKNICLLQMPLHIASKQQCPTDPSLGPWSLVATLPVLVLSGQGSVEAGQRNVFKPLEI